MPVSQRWTVTLGETRQISTFIISTLYFVSQNSVTGPCSEGLVVWILPMCSFDLLPFPLLNVYLFQLLTELESYLFQSFLFCPLSWNLFRVKFSKICVLLIQQAFISTILSTLVVFDVSTLYSIFDDKKKMNLVGVHLFSGYN